MFKITHERIAYAILLVAFVISTVRNERLRETSQKGMESSRELVDACQDLLTKYQRLRDERAND